MAAILPPAGLSSYVSALAQFYMVKVKFLMGFLATSQFKGALGLSPADACSKQSLRRRFECSSIREGFLQELYHTS